ncbi:MAG: hypothetical protein FWD81_04480, partial [Methanomassiliicoccaceae archaeon]|nr:hypothetical protein [Methanomassiliicoccaceae archaeon]
MDEVRTDAERKSMGKEVLDDIRQIGVVTKYELYKHLRSKRMYIFIGLAMLMIVLMRVLLELASGVDSVIDILGIIPDMAWYLFTVDMLVIIGVALFCAPALASEFEER